MSSRQVILKQFEEKSYYMNERIADGIETGRKGFAFVELVDEQGNAVKDAEFTISQKTHDFKYGANLFMLDEIPDDADKNEKYKQYFADAFNIATLPFYWDTLEPEPGKPRFAKDSPKSYRRPAPDLCLEFCDANGIEPKAHCLNYNSYRPEWVKGTVSWEKRCLEKRFRELAERYAGKIPMWEVTNETFWGYDKGNFYSQPDFIEWSFALAENYFPANKLIINDAHCRIWDYMWYDKERSPYYMQIERAMLKGARIDSIGMQYHMFYKKEDEIKRTEAYYDPERIYDIMDTYARLGRPLQITELTIPAYSNSAEDEELQAQIIRNLYSIWFSHPAMEAIVYWNLPDGYAYGAVPGDMTCGENYYYGGLIRFDFTPKPAYKVIQDLFKKEWRTNLKTHTDSSGKLSFKGFYGEYELTITAGGRKVSRNIHLNKEMNRHFRIEL